MSIQYSLHLCKPLAENRIAFLDDPPRIGIPAQHAECLFAVSSRRKRQNPPGPGCLFLTVNPGADGSGQHQQSSFHKLSNIFRKLSFHVDVLFRVEESFHDSPDAVF